MRYLLEVPHGASVEILLFTGVTNTKEFMKQVLSGELDVAALDAELIIDVFQVLVAVQNAVRKQLHGSLVCRSLSAEIIYNVSATRNIGHGLSQFGVRDATSSMIVVIYSVATKTAIQAVRQAICGVEVEDVTNGISLTANKNRIREAYNISSTEEDAGSLSNSVVTRIAVRDIR